MCAQCLSRRYLLQLLLNVQKYLFCVGECEKWLASETGWNREVVASSVFHHEGRLHLLLHFR